MYKAPATVQNTTEFIEKLETAKIDTTANVSFFRDEFKVKIILLYFAFFLNPTFAMKIKKKSLDFAILAFIQSCFSESVFIVKIITKSKCCKYSVYVTV